jgi:long-chain fatty acid transport protein
MAHDEDHVRANGPCRAGSALLALAFVLVAPAVHAGGLFLSEMATPDLGTAAAGRAAAAESAATAFGNPAGMSRLERPQVLVGLQGAYGDVRFDKDSATTVSGGNGGNAIGGFPGAGFYAVHPIGDDFRIGLSVGSNFGLSAEYEEGWSGRYYGTKEELVTLSAWPVASWRVNDWLSVGGGAQITYGALNSKTAVRNVAGGPDGQIQLDSDDVGFGGIAGVLVEPWAGTRFGVTYTSPIELDFKQRPDLTGGGPLFGALNPRISQARIDLGLTIPQTVTASAYHDVTPEIAVMGNLVWQDWSRFGKPTVEIATTTQSQATVNLDYDDTWGFALGGRWRFRPDWGWSLGVAFDTSPLSRSQRTPALPLDQQTRVGTGLQYAVSERATLGAAYEYAYLGEGDLDVDRGPLAGRVRGNYASNEIHFFNVTLSWTF